MDNFLFEKFKWTLNLILAGHPDFGVGNIFLHNYKTLLETFQEKFRKKSPYFVSHISYSCQIRRIQITKLSQISIFSFNYEYFLSFYLYYFLCLQRSSFTFFWKATDFSISKLLYYHSIFFISVLVYYFSVAFLGA